MGGDREGARARAPVGEPDGARAPAQTRDALIDAAIRVVAAAGLEAASVKAIAAEAGVTPGLLHYHFRNKDALLEAALRRALAGYREQGAERRAAASAQDPLDALFTDAREAVARDADLFRIRLAFAVRALADPDLAAVVRDLNAQAAHETALTLAAAAGRDLPDARDRALAAVLKAAFDGIVLARLVDPDFPLEDAARLLRDAVSR